MNKTEQAIRNEIERIRREEFPCFERVRRQKERLFGYLLAQSEAKTDLKKKIIELEKKAIEYDETTIGWYDEDWNNFKNQIFGDDGQKEGVE